jgi:hypothetical protein
MLGLNCIRFSSGVLKFVSLLFFPFGNMAKIFKREQLDLLRFEFIFLELLVCGSYFLCMDYIGLQDFTSL